MSLVLRCVQSRARAEQRSAERTVVPARRESPNVRSIACRRTNSKKRAVVRSAQERVLGASGVEARANARRRCRSAVTARSASDSRAGARRTRARDARERARCRARRSGSGVRCSAASDAVCSVERLTPAAAAPARRAFGRRAPSSRSSGTACAGRRRPSRGCRATSGVAITPSRSPSGESTQTPPGPVTQTLPSSSHSMPSTLPAARHAGADPLARATRPPESVPSAATSNTLTWQRASR